MEGTTKESSVSEQFDRSEYIKRHERKPILEALKKHFDEGIIPFHVPGHKYGAGNPTMTSYFGSRMMESDLNAMNDIDDLANPVGVIKEAQELAAEAFGADHAYYLINGTTSGIHAMILSALGQRERIIIPRDGHKSMYSALILSGASPIFIPPEIHPEFGFPLPPDPADIESIFSEVNQIQSIEIKGLFLINPSYYGLAPRMDTISDIARRENVALLVDEAHGSHFYFHPDLPRTAMDVGASVSALSMHKTGGSLTQASLLLRQGQRIHNDTIRNILDILRTSSSSYLLMSSLDTARSRLALEGESLLEKTLELSRRARKEISAIPGLIAPGPEELKPNHRIGSFDETRLTICVNGLGLNGFDVERILRKEYRIQIEMADFHTVVAIVTFADTWERLESLILALRDLAGKSPGRPRLHRFPDHPGVPPRVMNPRDAFYSRKSRVSLQESDGSICGEMIMAYPPGIPVICPGEVMTREIIEHVQALKDAGASLQGMADTTAANVQIVEGS